jgi:hypothetical protein
VAARRCFFRHRPIHNCFVQSRPRGFNRGPHNRRFTDKQLNQALGGLVADAAKALDLPSSVLNKAL